MTNNPTIDGVSLKLIQDAVNGNRQESREAILELREFLRNQLDAPAVERQELKPVVRVCGAGYDAERNTVWMETGVVEMPIMRKVEVGEELVFLSEVQSTIARLEARITQLESEKELMLRGAEVYKERIAELESGRGGAVAAKYQERVEFEKWIVGEWPTAPLRYVRDALPEDDPLHGTYCDEYLQRAWVGWQARACLDATAALNGDKP